MVFLGLKSVAIGRSFKGIHVFILHHYDNDKKIKKNADDLKDCLEHLPYIKKVTVIHENLDLILCNVDEWINEVLQEKDVKGRLNKIILVNSHEDIKVSSIEFYFP